MPNVDPYAARHLVELFPNGKEVKLLLTIDAMHDEEWTKRMVAGWEDELGRLATALAN